MPPTQVAGKICYVQIPAVDVHRSAGFYQAVFGWHIRRRSDGDTAFDDTSGEVSGTWVIDRPPSLQPGLFLYVIVASVERASEKIVAAGGEVVTPLTAQGEGEAFATFRDPAGNVMGVFQEPGVADKNVS
jgi:predicted enzyme related to lactoylglutathione lyase